MRHRCKTFFYLAVILSVAIMLMGATPSKVLPSSGEMKSNLYKSQYFDFQFTIPKGMTYFSKKEIDQQNDELYKEMLELKIITKEEIELAKKNRGCLFKVNKVNAKSMCYLLAEYSNIERVEDFDLDTYLPIVSEAAKARYRTMGLEYDDNIVYGKQKLGKYDYQYCDVKLYNESVKYNIRSFFRVKDQNLLLITVGYTDESSLKQLVKSFK